jgi:transcriptional regulator with XRE-family HTH domain
MSASIHSLFDRARQALHASQVEIGTMLGASRRTAQRWDAGKASPSTEQLQTLARRVYPSDPRLAAEIATATATTLQALGLVAPAPPPAPPQAAPPPPPPPVESVVDSMVCAAAEAIDVMPRVVRPALLAAFTRARELQLSVEAVERALQGKPAAKGERARKT